MCLYTTPPSHNWKDVPLVTFASFMYNMVIIVNTTTYLKAAKRASLKCSHHKKKTVRWCMLTTPVVYSCPNVFKHQIICCAKQTKNKKKKSRKIYLAKISFGSTDAILSFSDKQNPRASAPAAGSSRTAEAVLRLKGMTSDEDSIPQEGLKSSGNGNTCVK